MRGSSFASPLPTALVQPLVTPRRTSSHDHREDDMRLASKIFAASTVVILAFTAIAGWSLLAVNRLVRAHREIVSQSLPALQLEASLREAVRRLLRLEARYLVLGDRSYRNLLTEHAEQSTAEMERLSAFLRSPAEQEKYRRAVSGLAEYRRSVATEIALVGRGRAAEAVRVSEGPTRSVAAGLERALAELTEATSAEVDRAQAAVRALEARTWTTILIALSASLLAAVGMTGVIALRTTSSVRRLSEATARVANGSFTDPLPVTTRDEIGELTRSFNRMADRLREVEALKQRFFSHITHELRSPLTAISSASQLLQTRTADRLDGKQHRLLELIDTSVARLLRLINQILDFNRLRARVFPLERQPVALDKVMTGVVDLFQIQAAQQELALAHHATGSDFVIMADEEAMTKVITNLVGNAIKFTPAGGSILVELVDMGARVELAVRDNGPGVAADDLGRIFEPYVQAHHGRNGSGLGLAIVKELVEAHDGSVDVESRVGAGTVFTVRLPRTAPTP